MPDIINNFINLVNNCNIKGKQLLVSGKKTIKPHKCLNIMLLCYFHIKGLTLKPVRAGQLRQGFRYAPPL